jgi:hypothetical protein
MPYIIKTLINLTLSFKGRKKPSLFFGVGRGVKDLFFSSGFTIWRGRVGSAFGFTNGDPFLGYTLASFCG